MADISAPLQKMIDSLSPLDGMDEAFGSCLVTGGSGFIGRALIRLLLQNGVKVKAVINRTRLDQDHENLELRHFDLSHKDDNQYRGLLQGVDTVIHAAAISNLAGGLFARWRYFKSAYAVNVLATNRLLSASAEASVNRFIYISSIDVCLQPDMDEHLGSTTAYAAKPLSIYTETKIAAEKAVLAANSEYMKTLALRPAMVYGPDSNVALDQYVRLAREGKDVSLFDPHAEQDQTFLGNLLYAICLAAHAMNRSGSNVNGRAYFLTDAEPHLQQVFLEKLLGKLDCASPNKFIPKWLSLNAARAVNIISPLVSKTPPVMTPHTIHRMTRSLLPDMKEADAAFGYKPFFSVEQAMQLCAEYYRTAP